MTTPAAHLSDAEAQLLVDGALDPAEASRLEGHVAGCGACRATVDSYVALASALDDLEVPPLPAGFTAGVLGRIDAAERAAARERRHAVAILASVLAVTAAAFAAAGTAAWAPAVASAAGAIASAARALDVAARLVPTLVSALRLEILLLAASLALPLLVALVRLIPAPRAQAETA